MRSSYPTLMQDPQSQKQVIEFVEKCIRENSKYHSLAGRWQFSSSTEDHSGNHLYLYLGGDKFSDEDHQSLSTLMRELVLDICNKHGNSSTAQKINSHVVSSSVECNLYQAPYFIRILPGPCVDGLIECVSHPKEAFLQGTHPRLGSDSSVRKYTTDYIYDSNNLRQIFEFLAPLPPKTKESKSDSAAKNGEYSFHNKK